MWDTLQAQADQLVTRIWDLDFCKNQLQDLTQRFNDQVEENCKILIKFHDFQSNFFQNLIFLQCSKSQKLRFRFAKILTKTQT